MQPIDIAEHEGLEICEMRAGEGVDVYVSNARVNTEVFKVRWEMAVCI